MRTIIFILIVSFLVASGAVATTFKKFTAADLKSGATSVVMARVTKIQYEVAGGRPWTIVTLQVEQSLKGNASGSIRFRIPGGMQSVDGRTLITKVDAVPEIHNRERGIFFLESVPPSYPGLLGWNQGFYRVIEKGGQEYAIRSDGVEAPKRLKEFLKEFPMDSQGVRK